MIDMAIFARGHDLSPVTRYLSKKMLGPLCGMVQEIGFLRRESRSPKIIITGADLTGVHVVLNKPHPGRGGYHVGAAGINLNEALIKTFGESIERYAQLMAEQSGRFSTRFLSYDHLVALEGCAVLDKSKLNLFSPQQFKQTHFPFNYYVDQPLDWMKLPSLLSTHSMWVPTQLVLVGYQIKKAENEPWLSPAVTTGTAAHTDKTKALFNAVLELIQIDSAMGHWYSGRQAKKITFDSRTHMLEKIIMRQGNFNPNQVGFYWLENPDLAGFAIACVYRDKQSIPRAAVGLGADVSLVKAMYKAYLEAVGVVGLARMVVLQKKINYVEDQRIYDLDSNVGHYALGHHFSFLEEKFPINNDVHAAKLPPDIEGTDSMQLFILIESFKKSNKELLFCDLTCIESAELGFVVPRVWSPDTLSLCLPSAPWMQHPRYSSYGGIVHEFPHPYP